MYFSSACVSLAKEPRNVSATTANKYLQKLKNNGYIYYTETIGVNGMVVYLGKEVTSMFRLSDVLLDKKEIPMKVSVKLELDEAALQGGFNKIPQLREIIMKKVSTILSAQGFPCFGCRISPTSQLSTAQILIKTSVLNGFILCHFRNGRGTELSKLTKILLFHIAVNQQFPEFFITCSYIHS